MKKFLYKIRAYKKITQLNVERSLKRKIRASWFWVFFLRRYDRKNKVAKIAGFEVKFLNYQLLSFLFHEIFLGNEYNFKSETDNPFIIDCGSNIGMSVLYFKMLYPNSRIVAFEPGEESYNCLTENVEINKLSSVTTHMAALSKKEGAMDFYYNQKSPGSLSMSTVKERMSKQIRSVEGTPLSKHINEEVDFLKIDIEGTELEVIEDLYQANKLKYVKQMVIEYHHHIVGDSDEFSKLLNLLEQAGFGYQIESYLGEPLIPEKFQDILVYAYRKSLSTESTTQNAKS